MYTDGSPPDCPKCLDSEYLPDGTPCDHKHYKPGPWDKGEVGKWR